MPQPAEIYQFPARVSAPEHRRPQLEEGYTRTANALVEAFARAPLTSREARVIRVVERMTYGWNKPEDWIAASVISEMTGMPEGKCSETLNGLIRKRVLSRNGGGRSPVRINKNVSEWNFIAQKSRATPKRNIKPIWGESPQLGVSESPQVGNTPKDRKDNLEPIGSKKTSKKSSPKKWGEPVDHDLAEAMFAKISEDLTNPKRPNMTSWANDFRLMRDRDGRTAEQIRYLITWTAEHHFWSTVILCPAKMRAKWDQLEKQVKQLKESRHENRYSTGRQRTERDRVAAGLANPHDTSWADGLFDEGGSAESDRGAGEPGIYSTGGDFSEDVADVFHDRRNDEAGEAGACVIDGEMVFAADDGDARYGY